MTATTEPANERQQLVATWVDRSLARLLDETAHEHDRSRSAEIRIALGRHLALDDQETA
jgi:hypothetical protein